MTGSTNVETIAAQLERDIANAVRETLSHGGSEKDVRQLVQQLKVIADEEDAKVTDKQIPD